MNTLFSERKAMPVMEALFNALCEHPYGLTNKEIADKIYADREDGGPDWSAVAINLHVMRFNRFAKQYGLNLRIRSLTNSGRRYSLFLVRP